MGMRRRKREVVEVRLFFVQLLLPTNNHLGRTRRYLLSTRNGVTAATRSYNIVLMVLVHVRGIT